MKSGPLQRDRFGIKLEQFCETGGLGLWSAYKLINNSILGLYWDNGKENGNYRDYRVYIGVILRYFVESRTVPAFFCDRLA